MDLLDSRKADELPIFRAFVEKVLKRRSQEILAEQNLILSGFKSDFWQNHSMRTTDVNLVYSHAPVHRFADMKTRRVKGNRKSKIQHKIHNSILMGNYAGIMGELTYGLTEDMKTMIRNNIEKTQI